MARARGELVTASLIKGSLTVEGEHGEEVFHIRFGPGPMDLIILAPRLAPSSSNPSLVHSATLVLGKHE